ncbi:hypothetical protein QAD02_019581 [Eretmocerus hayati]|uniref:Uncharacterized protein n=1 Tax=Eretmocerus hayati TaxID=131215 RepID=A0ACC2PKG3_9HYME|nr:hypothetical protein QAD02_019581 [Eretmocerus hayati]
MTSPEDIMEDEGGIILQLTNQIDHGSSDSDVEILSDVDCDLSTSKFGRNGKNEQLFNSKSPAALAFEKLDSQKEEIMVMDEIILLDSSDERDENESNKDSNDKINVHNGSDCNKIRIESATDEITLQESNMKIEAFEIESDEELIIFDFSDLTAEDVLKAVENGQLQSKESDELNTNEITAEVINADNPTLQDPCKNNNILDLFSPFIHMCCKSCTLLKNLESDNSVKFCPKCQKLMMYQCKLCKSRFFKWTLICTHLTKFHQVLSRYDGTKSLPERANSLPQQKSNKTAAPLGAAENQRAGTCYKCGIMFQNTANLKSHEEICETSPYFLCKYCGLRTISKKNLRQHLVNQHREDFNEIELDDILCDAFNVGLSTGPKDLFIGSCLKCDVRSKLVNGEYSCETCDSPIVYECGDPNCSKNFFWIQELRNHVTMFHHRRICDECLQPMENQQCMVEHAKSCGVSEKIPKYFCSVCSYEAYSIHEFVLHLIKTHPKQRIVPLYKCSSCKSKKVYKTMKYFKEHISHYCSKLNNLLKCAHCRYQTLEKKKIRIHLRCNHVELFTGKRLICRKCGLKWSSIFKLNNHVGGCTGVPSATRKMSTKRKRRKQTKQYTRRKKA